MGRGVWADLGFGGRWANGGSRWGGFTLRGRGAGCLASGYGCGRSPLALGDGRRVGGLGRREAIWAVTSRVGGWGLGCIQCTYSANIVVHHAGVRGPVPGAIRRPRPARRGFHPVPNEAFGVPAALPAGGGDGLRSRWAGSGKFNRSLSARLPPRPLSTIYLSLGSTGINRPLGLTGAGIFYFTRNFRLWVEVGRGRAVGSMLILV